MSIWVGGSVADVKLPQAVLPTKTTTLTLLPASPWPTVFLDLFVRTPLASYGAIGQKERWTPMASYRAEWVNSIASESFNFFIYDNF